MSDKLVAADISVAVIHNRAKRSCTARRREVVNNCAAGENLAGGRPAPARSQSQSRTPRGSLVGHWPSRRPLLRHLIERGLKKAIISARWTAGQSDAKTTNRKNRA